MTRFIKTTIVFASALSCSSAFAESSWLQKQFEKPMALAGGVLSMGWSPDSQYVVAFTGGADPWFIDVKEKSVKELKTSVPFGSAMRGDVRGIAWSRNGVLIATRGGGVNGNIQLASFPEFKPLNSIHSRDWKSRLPKCKTDPDTSDLVFTSDNQFLWIGCKGTNEQGRFTIAVKLSIPDLEVVDQVEAELPENGQGNETRHGWFHIDQLTENITYYMLATGSVRIQQECRQRPPGPECFAAHRLNGRPNQYIVAVNLSDKNQVKFDLISEPGPVLSGTGRFLRSPNGSVAYITDDTVGSIMEDGKPTSRITLYLLRNSPGGQLERFDIDQFIGKSRSQLHAYYAMKSATLISDSELIIGTSRIGAEELPGTMYKIAFRDGKETHAKITSFYGVSISPDQRHMVSVVNTFHLRWIDRILSRFYDRTQPMIYTGIWQPGGSGPKSGVEIFSLSQ